MRHKHIPTGRIRWKGVNSENTEMKNARLNKISIISEFVQYHYVVIFPHRFFLAIFRSISSLKPLPPHSYLLAPNCSHLSLFFWVKKQFSSSILWNWFRYWALDLIVVVVVCAEKRKFKMKNVQYESITNIAYRCGERKELVWQVERVCTVYATKKKLVMNVLILLHTYMCVAKCCLWACQISTSWISYFVSFYGILKIEFEKGSCFYLFYARNYESNSTNQLISKFYRFTYTLFQ